MQPRLMTNVDPTTLIDSGGASGTVTQFFHTFDECAGEDVKEDGATRQGKTLAQSLRSFPLQTVRVGLGRASLFVI